VAAGPPAGALYDYLDLLDRTGRAVAAGKTGRIPPDLAPILERLQIDVDRWVATVTRFGRWFRRAAGSAQALCAEAARVARRWLRGVGPARLAFPTALTSCRDRPASTPFSHRLAGNPPLAPPVEPHRARVQLGA